MYNLVSGGSSYFYACSFFLTRVLTYKIIENVLSGEEYHQMAAFLFILTLIKPRFQQDRSSY